MTVRTKAIALVAAALVVALVSIHLVAHTVLIPSYASLETSVVSTNVEQTLHALDARLTTLDATNNDWASWDDTYQYVATRDADYTDSNLVDATFGTIGVNVVALLDTTGDVLYARAYDFVAEQEIAVPADLLELLTGDAALLQQGMSIEGVQGILSLAEGPALLSVRPILTSEDEGPARGTFVMAAFLDENVLEQVGTVTRISLALTTLTQSSSKAGYGGPSHAISATDVAVTPMGADVVEGSAIVRDLYGVPVLRVTILRDRDIYAEGQHTLSVFLTILAIGGAVLCILAMLLADRTIFRRLSLLASEVRAIGEMSDFSREVTVRGDDEVAFLATAINDTLGTLAKTHLQLRNSHAELEQTTADLKNAQQELGRTANRLRRLTRHLQAMREDERALVANEIHDQIGQGLTALKMDLAALQRAADRGEQLSPALAARVTGVADTLLETVRRLSSGLRPSMLEDLGLAEAFEWHLGEFAAAKGISTSLKVQGPLGSVEAGRSLTLFRILEEALQVSAEDSTITEVTVTLTIESRYALLAVQDNGVAALEGDALTRREMGLTLIRERTEVYGGGATTTSAPGSGTTVVAQIPL